MAILNKIRQRSLFLILVIALALFSFVLADLFKNSSGFSSKKQNIVASVNGKDIERDAFMNLVENMQSQFGSSRSNTQVMNMVYDRELRKMILETQYDELGLSIERDKMRSLLEQNLSSYEEFKNEDGFFDENKLNEFIATLKQFPDEVTAFGGTQINYALWTNFESNVAQSAKEQIYFNMVKAGVFATLTEGEQQYRLENDQVDIKYVQIPFSSIPDSTIVVTKSDINTYIKENESEFKVEASRDIVFVEFKEVASLEDEKNIEQDLIKLIDDTEEYNANTKQTIKKPGFKNTTDYTNFLADHSATPYDNRFVFKPSLPENFADSLYNLDLNEIFGPYKDAGFMKLSKLVEEKNIPDSAEVRHILLPFVGSARAAATVTQTEEEAKKTADSILSIVKRDRTKFPQLVTEFSSDQGSVTKGGIYDLHPYGTMVSEFNDFEFNGKKGDLKVVKTVFGFHIIEILDQTAPKKAIKLATITRAIEPSEKTVDDVFNKTSKFEIAVEDADFNTVAKKDNYTVNPVNGIKVLDENIPGLGEQRNIVRWAFNDETKVGDIRRFSISSGGFVVVKLQANNPEGLMSIEKASITALPAIRKEKKATLIKNKISATTLQDIASAENVTVQTANSINMKSPTLSGAGREPKVIGAAFALKENETSKAITGEKGIYFIEVVKVKPAVELPNYQANTNRLSTESANGINNKVYQALEDAAEIYDNRKTFY